MKLKVLWVVALTLLLPAPPAAADFPAESLDVVTTFHGRGQDDDATRTFAKALTEYIEDRAPADDSPARRAFFANLQARIVAMDDEEIADLAAAAEPKDTAGERGQSAAGPFFDVLDAVAWFTLATDELQEDVEARVVAAAGERPATSGSYVWQRRPDDQPRLADADTDWDRNSEHFEMARHLDTLDWNNKKQFTRETGLPSSQEEWGAAFADRLRRLYSDPEIDLDQRLSEDLGRAHALMLTTDPETGRPLALTHLRELADRLGPAGFNLDWHGRQAGSVQAATAANAQSELEQALHVRELEHGFQPHALMPDGLLDAGVFLGVIAAGYVMDDVGAGEAHGALSHRIQWNALMDHFESTDGWFTTPLEMYTAIGELDVALAETNTDRRFAFERTPSLWAQIFDQQGGANTDLSDAEAVFESGDFSRPDYVRPFIAHTPELAAVGTRLEATHRARQARGERLAELYDAGKLPFEISAEDRQRIDTFDEREAEGSREDELFKLETYQTAERLGGFERAEHDGQPLNLLIEAGGRFTLDPPDRRALDRQRRAWRDQLGGREPARPVADVPRQPGDHEVAVKIERPRSSRERLVEESPRRERLDREPEPPAGAFELVAAPPENHERALSPAERRDQEEESARERRDARMDDPDFESVDDEEAEERGERREREATRR